MLNTLALFVAAVLSAGFTVERNVNTTAKPVEKIVIFDGKQEPFLKIEGEKTKPTIEDGVITGDVTGHAETTITLRWTDQAPWGESIDLTQYDYVVVETALEGEATRSFPNGKERSERGGNLYFVMTANDDADVRTSMVNFASITPDETTPATMTEMRIPTLFFTDQAYNDPTKIKSIVFRLPGTHDYYNRQFQMKIKRVSLANLPEEK